MKTLLMLSFACVAQVLGVERSMKVDLPQANPKAIFDLLEPVEFNLVVTTKSVEDQNALERLTVDDWRYDEPNYFADGRVPNVVLHVERKRTDGGWDPVPFRASSSGGGASLDRITAMLMIEVFPGSSDVQAVLMRHLLEKAVADKMADEAAKQQIANLLKAFRAASVGDFRLTATYTGAAPTGGRIILKAPQITFTIKDKL